MKKKFLAVVTAAVMAASLAGCGSNANANNPNATSAATTAAGRGRVPGRWSRCGLRQ